MELDFFAFVPDRPFLKMAFLSAVMHFPFSFTLDFESHDSKSSIWCNTESLPSAKAFSFAIANVNFYAKFIYWIAVRNVDAK